MKKIFFWFLPIAALAVATVWYLPPKSKRSEQRSPSEEAPPATPPIRYPLELDSGTAEPLPPLNQSDTAMRDALQDLFGNTLHEFFNVDDIVRRIVATIDNLPRDNVPIKLSPLKRVPGLFVTTGADERLSVSPQNAARYRPYVRIAETVPTQPLIAAYTHFYPLFQEQYENLGYPGKYFNDRLVEVIDHLLETPDIQEPVLLSQPRVLYEFADLQLEGLSAGQKMLLRMGRQNTLAVKAKLEEIRQAVVAKTRSGQAP
jgi:hypothetical protein